MNWLPLRYLTRNLGVPLMLLLLVSLWALYRGGVNRLYFALPTLIYNAATMLLLCGQDARFFSFSVAVSFHPFWRCSMRRFQRTKGLK